MALDNLDTSQVQGHPISSGVTPATQGVINQRSTDVELGNGILARTNLNGGYWYFYDGNQYSTYEEALFAQQQAAKGLLDTSDGTPPIPTGSALDPSNFSQTQISYEEALQHIYDLFYNEHSTLGTYNSLATNGISIMDSLKQIYTYVKSLGWGDNASARELSSQIYDMLFNWYNSQYQAIYQQSTWLQQQEYNSPQNQVKRLIQAGINPAFYFSSLSSGNASSSAGSSVGSGGSSPVAQLQSPTHSDVEQRNQSTIESILGVVGAFNDSIKTRDNHTDTLTRQASANASVALARAQADQIHQLTPLQVQDTYQHLEMLSQQERYLAAQTGREVNAWNVEAGNSGLEYNIGTADEPKYVPYTPLMHTFYQLNQDMKQKLLDLAYNYYDTNTKKEIAENTLKNDYRIAVLDNNTKRYLGKLSASVEKYCANLDYKKAVETTAMNNQSAWQIALANNETAKQITDKQYKYDALKTILQACQVSTTVDRYYEVKDGKVSKQYADATAGAEGSLYGAKFTFAGKIGSEDVYETGGKKYVKRQETQTRLGSPYDIINGFTLVETLMNDGILSPEAAMSASKQLGMWSNTLYGITWTEQAKQDASHMFKSVFGGPKDYVGTQNTDWNKVDTSLIPGFGSE